MSARRTAEQNRIDRALILSRHPPRKSIDVQSDPLALVVAAVNELIDRAWADGDDTLKACGLLLLADIGKRRREAGIAGAPIELAYVEGRA